MGYSTLLGDVERCVMGVNVKIEKEVLDCIERKFSGFSDNEEYYGVNCLITWFENYDNYNRFIDFLDELKIEFAIEIGRLRGSDRIFKKSLIKEDQFKKLTEAVKKMIEQEKFEEIKSLVKELFSLENMLSDKNCISFYIDEGDSLYNFCIEKNIKCYKFISERTGPLGHKIKDDSYILEILFNCDHHIELILTALREEKKRRDKIKKLDEELSRMGAPIASPEHIKSWEAWFNKKSIADEQSPPKFSKQTRQELKAYRQKLNKVKARIDKKIGHVDALIGGDNE